MIAFSAMVAVFDCTEEADLENFQGGLTATAVIGKPTAVIFIPSAGWYSRVCSGINFTVIQA